MDWEKQIAELRAENLEIQRQLNIMTVKYEAGLPEPTEEINKKLAVPFTKKQVYIAVVKNLSGSQD